MAVGLGIDDRWLDVHPILMVPYHTHQCTFVEASKGPDVEMSRCRLVTIKRCRALYRDVALKLRKLRIHVEPVFIFRVSREFIVGEWREVHMICVESGVTYDRPCLALGSVL